MQGDDVKTDITQEWMAQNKDLVRKTVVPQGVPEAEFELFLIQCIRTGLDPLQKQCYCVPRRQKVTKNGRDEWVTKYEFQASRDGMLVRANKFPDFKGIQSAEVYADDKFALNRATGDVVEHISGANRKGALSGAWARVLREGRLPILKWVDFAGYVQSTPLWSKMPATMIAKVAEAAALRSAFPEAFSGIYFEGERHDDHDEAETVVESGPFGRTTAPALPSPAPRVTLETTPAKEPMPVRAAATEKAVSSRPAPEPEDAQVEPSAPPTREPGDDSDDTPSVNAAPALEEEFYIRMNEFDDAGALARFARDVVRAALEEEKISREAFTRLNAHYKARNAALKGAK